MNKRTVKIQIRLTQEEYDSLQGTIVAMDGAVSMSVHIRTLIFGKEIRPINLKKAPTTSLPKGLKLADDPTLG